MTKNDLKNGAVVETRNGERFLLVDGLLLDLAVSGEFLELADYNDSLVETGGTRKYDIMKVMLPTDPRYVNTALIYIRDGYKWTWERKEELEYWYVDVFNTVQSIKEDDSRFKSLGRITKVFNTKDEAITHKLILEYRHRYEQYITERNATLGGIDWNNDQQEKILIGYDYGSKIFVSDRGVESKMFGGVYALDFKFIEEFMNSIGENTFKKYVLCLEDSEISKG